MKNNKGFTLVELLAVIVIMGILMMVAIPSVTRTIENSRKDTFVDIAKSYANAARSMWTTDNLTCNGTVSSAVDDGDYYILINSKETAKDSLPTLVDQGGKSSWGNRDVNGYVRVNVSTTAGVDNNNDGTYEVEPRRVTKFYVALSDGTHGLIDDDTLMMDELKRGNVFMTLSPEQLKKIELTVDDGKLDCAIDANGKYSCTAVNPIKSITGICVDDQTNVGVTGNAGGAGGATGVNFATDDWETVIEALQNGNHPYEVGDTKTVDMGSFGTHTIRLANLTPCDGSLESETACGVVLEFADIITKHNMNSSNTNVGGWPATSMRAYLNNDIYSALPSALQSAIIDTKVVSGHGSTSGEGNFTSTDKLYLLSTAEVWENGTTNTINSDSTRSSTRQLDYYQGVTTNNYSKAIKQYNGTNTYWWLRAARSDFTYYFFAVTGNGGWNSNPANNTHGAYPAFRIA